MELHQIVGGSNGPVCSLLHFNLPEKKAIANYHSAGGCSTAVEPMPHNKEVVGSNLAGCWAFFLSSLSSQ